MSSASRRRCAILLALAAGLPACSGPRTSGKLAIVAAAIPATDHQTAQVGTALPVPLQVRVLVNGKPAPGQPVSWSPSSGSMAISSGITDAGGFASAQWLLGSNAGEVAAYATVPGALGSPVQFSATALPAKQVPDSRSTTANRRTP